MFLSQSALLPFVGIILQPKINLSAQMIIPKKFLDRYFKKRKKLAIWQSYHNV